MKCKECDKLASWRLLSGYNGFGGKIFEYYCDEHRPPDKKPDPEDTEYKGSHIYLGW
jgi:hypothetical protein